MRIVGRLTVSLLLTLGTASLAETLDAWRSRRAELVDGPGGWLQLRRQLPLAHGTFLIGTASVNDVVLEQGPAEFGSLSVDENGARFEAAPGIWFEVDGEPENQLPLSIETAARAPTVLNLERVGLYLTRDEDRLWLRILDPAAGPASGFAGLEYYPAQPDWLLPATFEPAAARRDDLPGALGWSRSAFSPGVVHFQYDEMSITATVLAIEGRPVLAFRDRTNSAGTYPGGRYLELPPALPREFTLDFNRAFNPPCAFSPAVNCGSPALLVGRTEAGLGLRATAGAG